MSALRDDVDLARRVVDAFSGTGHVAMALVTGSVARGLADAASDVDVFLYDDDIDRSQLDRPDQLQHLGGRRLFGMPTATGWFEKYHVEGRFVDVERVNTAVLDTVVAALQGDVALEPSIEQMLVGLRDALPIVGAETLTALRPRLTYGDGLARAQAQAHLPGLLTPVALWRLTYERGDHLSFAARISATMLDAVALLGAVNRTFVVTSEPKWMPWQIGRFELCPHDMMNRINHALADPTTDTMSDLGEMLDDVVTLVETTIPGVATAAARFALSFQP